MTKSGEDFHKHKITKDGYNTYCKVCANQRTKLWQQENPERHNLRKKDNHYKTDYGITYKDYLVLYEQQEGLCRICNNYQEVLHVDHCHNSSNIRGLLCGKCNRGLGMFDDNIAYLDKAKEYLKSAKEN